MLAAFLGCSFCRGFSAERGTKVCEGKVCQRQQRRKIPCAITRLQIDHLSSWKIDIPRQGKKKEEASSGELESKGQ